MRGFPDGQNRRGQFTAARGKADCVNAVRERLVERCDDPRSGEKLRRARGARRGLRIGKPLRGAQDESRKPHREHCARRGTDVARMAGARQHDADAREPIVGTGVRWQRAVRRLKRARRRHAWGALCGGIEASG